MINNKQSEKLKASWGYKAESMASLAEVRVYDPLSSWQCYIFAQNPEHEDEVMCLISGGNNLPPEVTEWKLSEMTLAYNAHGEGLEIDIEYVPRRAAELFKILNEGF